MIQRENIMTRQLPIEVAGDAINAHFGKLIAFTPVVSKHGCALGVAVANEPGYMPIPEGHFVVDRYDEALAEANRLNRDVLEIDEKTAIEVIASSMRKGEAS